MAVTVDIWTVCLGAVILGITNKIIEYYWETHGKPRLQRIDRAIFRREEEVKQNSVHEDLSRRINSLQRQINEMKKGVNNGGPVI